MSGAARAATHYQPAPSEVVKKERGERRLFIFETANRAVVNAYLGGRAGEDTLPTVSENLPTLAELPETLFQKILRNI